MLGFYRAEGNNTCSVCKDLDLYCVGSKALESDCAADRAFAEAEDVLFLSCLAEKQEQARCGARPCRAD